MITDDFLLFAQAQASVRAAGSYTSTNVLDVGAKPRDIGSGEQLQILITIDIAFAGGTSVDFQIITADDAAMSVNVTQIGSTGPILEAVLVPGYLRYVDMPNVPGVGQRYVAIRAVGVGVHTAGSFSARMVKDVVDAKTYGVGYTIQ
jgi:hypothetical protein